MRIILGAILASLLCARKVSTGMLAPTDTITWGGDVSRTGYQTTHNMDPAVVGSAQFGQLWVANLPGNYHGVAEQLFAQSLVYTLNDGVQYVFLATTQNNVYKLNAKTGEIVASRNLHIPFLTSELDGCVDINPLIGVTATGVIDPDTDTWYLTAKTYLDQSDQIKGRLNGRYYFHAIDVNTLAEKPNFPVNMEGIIGRNNPNRMFQGGNAHQRPALLHNGQFIYAGFASHCVQYNFTGWIMGFDKTTGANVESFATEGGPEPNTVPGGGVWMSGGGLASDGKGSMFFATGNGYASQLSGTPVPGRQPPTALEEAAVNMKLNSDGTLTIVDFFMPWEKQQLDGADKDLGTTPLELLQTDVFTCPNAKRLGVVTGKSGKTYILNLDNLGGYQEGPGKYDNVPQVWQNENSVYAGAAVYPLEGGYIYINVIQYQTHVYKFSCDGNGNPVFTHVADTPEKNAYILGVGHGTTTSLNGQPGTGLFWVSDVEGFNLRVYKAVPENGALSLIQTANIPGVTKFTRPVFGDGRAYIGTTVGKLYCFGSPVNLPFNCSSPIDFGNTLLGSTSIAQTIQCQANIDTSVTAVTLSGNANFIVTTTPNLPYSVQQGQNFTFQAVFKPNTPGPLSSSILLNTTNGVGGFAGTTPVALKGTGDSLKPLLAVTPNTVSFNGPIITGQQAGGVTESVIFSNQGDSTLNITGIAYSILSEGGPTVAPKTTAQGPQVGPFTFLNLPTSIPGLSSVTVNINFNPNMSGNYATYITVNSNGGSKIFDVVGTSGTYPVALLEFQAADGSGTWIPYKNNSSPFRFGNVLEQQTKTLAMRLTNNGANSSASLSVTVSKPPYGVPGIIGASNDVDLTEGTILGHGQSATANLFCSVPRSQVNVNAYNGTAMWTMNTGDPNFGKQYIQFTCDALAEQVGPLYANGSAKYRYAGCYKEFNPGRQLSYQALVSNEMTNDICIQACAAQNYAFAATQYASECWCGQTIPNMLVDDANCNYPCAATASETCGGNGMLQTGGSYMSLFSNGAGGSTPTGPTSGPSIVQAVGSYVYTGCYTEATNGRALTAKALSSPDMTIEHCAGNCTGSELFGSEYGAECYCGASLASGSVRVPDSDCSMTCAGNGSEFCGNGNRLSLYKLKSTFTNATSSIAANSSTSVASLISTSQVSVISAMSSTMSVASSTSTGPAAVKSAGAFIYQGCRTEASNNQRALSSTTFANDSMTVEACATFCSGHTYMGIEYARECYCGDTITDGSVAAPESDCDMNCLGNPSEFCGAGNRLSFYQSQPAIILSTTTQLATTQPATTQAAESAAPSAGKFSYIGCQTEAANYQRALSAISFANDSMTVEACATFCSAYVYMGVEYSRECYCGNSLAAGSVPAAASDCSMTCDGNTAEFCGGPNRLNLYQKLTMNQSSTTSTFTAKATLTQLSTWGASSSLILTQPSSLSTSTSNVTWTKPSTFSASTSNATLARSSTASSTANFTRTQSPTSSSFISMFPTTRSATSGSSTSNMTWTQSPTPKASNSTLTRTQISTSGASTTNFTRTQPPTAGAATSNATLTRSSNLGPSTSNVTLTHFSTPSSSTSNATLTKSSTPSVSTSNATLTRSSTPSYSATSLTSTRSSTLNATSTHMSTSGSPTSSLTSTQSSTFGSSSSSNTTLTHFSTASTSTSNFTSTKSSTPGFSTSSLTSTQSSTSGSSPLNVTSTKFSTPGASTSSLTSTQWSTTGSSTSSLTSTHSSTSTTSTSSATRSSTIPTPSTSTIVQGNANFTYAGCFIDSTRDRAVHGLLANDSMTVEDCLAASYNNKYVGLEYGRECWFGNTINTTTAVQASAESQCNFRCAGNSSEICGGSNRLTLYVRHGVPKPGSNVTLSSR